MSDTPESSNADETTSGAEPELLSVDDLIGTGPIMPEVQAHTVEAARASSADKAEPAVQNAGHVSPVKGITDDIGRPFDPSIHESTDGKPRLNKAGFIAKRRGGASKGGAATASKVNTKPKDAKAAPVPQDLEPQIIACAQMSTGIFLTMAGMVGGEEFKPIVDKDTGENEPEMITTCFANYYRVKGIIDIPPGIALTLGLGFFVAKRWNAPKFTERKERWFGSVRRWWSDFRLRRKMAREARNAHDAELADGTAQP